MTIKEVKYSLNALTKPSQILRKAAEHLEYDRQMYTGDLQDVRNGCCAAFEEVREAAYNSQWTSVERGLKPQSIARLKRKVNQTVAAADTAEVVFQSLFKPKGGKLFWFGGSFSDKQQEHRITALLTTAAILEAEGK